MSELSPAEQEIYSFFSEFPDDRMGLQYVRNAMGNWVFQMRIFEKDVAGNISKLIGEGYTVVDVLFEARKYLAIQKVKVLATLTEVPPNDFAAAVKRAANYATDQEMADLLSEIHRKIPIKGEHVWKQ